MAVDGSTTRRCRVADCTNTCVHETFSDGTRINSSYCQEHTCQRPRDRHHAFCINPRNPANRYCAFDGKCITRSCTRQALRSEKDIYPYLCPHHRCERCTSPRVDGYRLCKAHLTCQVRGCPNHPDLNHPGLLCRNHACTMDLRCPLPAIGMVAGRSHCARHIPCGTVRGCTNPRVTLSNGQLLPHCSEHYVCLRAGPDCRPNAVVRPGTRFCFSHKCSLEACPMERVAHSHYCLDHTCAHDVCVQIVSDPASETAVFCTLHECSVDGCEEKARSIHGFCDNHGCEHGTCLEIRKGNSYFCAEHRCQSEGCKSEALHKNGYCLRHACDFRDCRQPRLGRNGGDNIDICLLHWRAHLETEISHEARRKQARLQELEEEERIKKAVRKEEEERRLRRELEKRLAAEDKRREAEEALRLKELKKEADRQEEIREEAARLLDMEKREARRRREDDLRRQEDEHRRRQEAADLRERAARRREAERRLDEDDRRRREREGDARLRARLSRTPTEFDDFRHVPVSDFGRGGSSWRGRDSWVERDFRI